MKYRVTGMLIRHGVELWRLGKTADGSPKHPLARGKHHPRQHPAQKVHPMTIRQAFIDSTYRRSIFGTSRPIPDVWQWWIRIDRAYKRMWPDDELLEPPANESSP